ncbi:MAG TPA: hypothetical protein VG826_03735 [Pirellulales bacterium]|nr:hypothetical protein [Pirellulales bacterium]
MLNSKSPDTPTPLRSRIADKWRFVLIMIANVWLVFVIMRFGIAWQQQGRLEPGQAGGRYSLMATLLASTALVATVLGLASGVLVWRRSRSNDRTRLAVYRGDDAPPDSMG